VCARGERIWRSGTGFLSPFPARSMEALALTQIGPTAELNMDDLFHPMIIQIFMCRGRYCRFQNGWQGAPRGVDHILRHGMAYVHLSVQKVLASLMIKTCSLCRYVFTLLFSLIPIDNKKL